MDGHENFKEFVVLFILGLLFHVGDVLAQRIELSAPSQMFFAALDWWVLQPFGEDQFQILPCRRIFWRLSDSLPYLLKNGSVGT